MLVSAGVQAQKMKRAMCPGTILRGECRALCAQLELGPLVSGSLLLTSCRSWRAIQLWHRNRKVMAQSTGQLCNVKQKRERRNTEDRRVSGDRFRTLAPPCGVHVRAHASWSSRNSNGSSGKGERETGAQVPVLKRRDGCIHHTIHTVLPSPESAVSDARMI